MAAPMTKCSKEKHDLTVWSEGAKSINFIKHDSSGFGNFICQRKAYNNWKGSKDSKPVLIHVAINSKMP